MTHLTPHSQKVNGDLLLDEFQAHLFLEKRGETLTVADLREILKVEVDIDKNRSVAFLEFALWKWNKRLIDMFFPVKPSNPEALAALDKAIDEYRQVRSLCWWKAVQGPRKRHALT